MFLKIKDVLPAEDLAAIRTAVEAAEFIDGAATGKRARRLVQAGDAPLAHVEIHDAID